MAFTSRQVSSLEVLQSHGDSELVQQTLSQFTPVILIRSHAGRPQILLTIDIMYTHSLLLSR
jgi:hypothetical protein